VANLAETGRATHKIIVNTPNSEAFFGKWMRKSFTCKKGWKLVGTDSAGCQIRMLAARMGDKEYMETVLNGDKDKGTDIHSVNMRAAGLDSRGKAKTFFYGFLFGAGDAKVGRIVKGTAEDGRKLKAQFLAGLPALANLISSLTTEWRKNARKRPNKWGKVEYYQGWFTGLDGRPIFVESEHAILVYALQSDEAIMMAAAYCWAYKELCAKYKWGEDFGIVNWNHDEYTIECREEIANEVAKIAEECIVKAGKYYKIACPHAGEAAIGNNWYEIH
jgi:DNA polymerase I-like protein with 3'-5' exonuclease and polymerase domains